jgi:hypothetical protein
MALARQRLIWLASETLPPDMHLSDLNDINLIRIDTRSDDNVLIDRALDNVSPATASDKVCSPL